MTVTVVLHTAGVVPVSPLTVSVYVVVVAGVSTIFELLRVG